MTVVTFCAFPKPHHTVLSFYQESRIQPYFKDVETRDKGINLIELIFERLEKQRLLDTLE